MRSHTRHVLMTLAYAFIGGELAGAFVACLLVPAWLSVSYLVPITVSGALVGLLAGAVIAWLTPTQRRALQ